MTNLASVRVTVHGRVQGIGFRYFIMKYAVELGLTGYVCNLPDTTAIEVEAEGERDQLEKLIEYLEVGALGTKVETVDIDRSEYSGDYSKFDIRR
ncbi:MAG: acylphosphatase [Dehalococcoidales bacterium]|jgi:acylphosphatase|nr:acylphosphatase [Dehalococcoidales bacterium]MDP6126673.1 acylphosphatase [Dehalococcoidales bacterium]MDP6632389.1 acylphosphatase [Dehalococcoidales bacterium]MDP7525649.1 acylphosphatase [Dehalococcoidales bacterium]